MKEVLGHLLHRQQILLQLLNLCWNTLLHMHLSILLPLHLSILHSLHLDTLLSLHMSILQWSNMLSYALLILVYPSVSPPTMWVHWGKPPTTSRTLNTIHDSLWACKLANSIFYRCLFVLHARSLGRKHWTSYFPESIMGAHASLHLAKYHVAMLASFWSQLL